MKKLISDIQEGDIIAFNKANHFRADIIRKDNISCTDCFGKVVTLYKESYQLPQDILAIGISSYNFSIGNY